MAHAEFRISVEFVCPALDRIARAQASQANSLHRIAKALEASSAHAQEPAFIVTTVHEPEPEE